MRRAVRWGWGTALGLLVCAGAEATTAEIGVVTIDGERIPEARFVAYEERHRATLCPPRSDRRVRDEVILMTLYLREGERRALALTGHHEVGERLNRQELERLPNDVPSRYRRSLVWKLEEGLWHGYRAALIGEIDEATRIERYRRAIEARHPDLVDVPLFRYVAYAFPDRAARERARGMIEAGVPIALLDRLGQLGTSKPFEGEEWRMFEGYGYLEPEEIRILRKGDVVYPERYDGRGIVHVIDRKVLSRIRPYQEINGDDYHARRVAYSLEFEERRAEIEASLVNGAHIEEDGTEIDPRGTYPACDDGS